MTAEFVSASPLFGSLHERLEDPARDALSQFVQRCDEADYAWSVAELMFLYAMGIATVTAAVVDQRRGTTTELLAYINDEMQASFLMFLDAEADEEDAAARPTAEAVAAGYLDAEVRFYYEVVAIALETLQAETSAIARGDAWAALSRAVDAAYERWEALVSRHADFGELPADKLQLLTSCTVVMALRVLSRMTPAGIERETDSGLDEDRYMILDLPAEEARLAS